MRLISAFTSDTDKALWRPALPMIFSNITVPLLGLVDTAVIGHLDSPIYPGRRDRRGGDQLPVHAAVVPAHEHHRLWRRRRWGTKPAGAGARLYAAAAAGAAGRGAIVLLRYPLIELALQIVGGNGEVLEQARRFLEIRWLSAPAALANWCCWAGCSACSTCVRR